MRGFSVKYAAPVVIDFGKPAHLADVRTGLSRGFQAVHFRQVYIQNDYIRLEFRDLDHRFGSIRSLSHNQPLWLLLESRTQPPPHGVMIVYHEDSRTVTHD